MDSSQIGKLVMLKICVCLRKIGKDFPYFWRGSLSDLAKRESKLLPILKSFFFFRKSKVSFKNYPFF